MNALPITQNPLRTRADVQEAVRQLTDPLGKLFSAGCARIQIGSTGANYPEEIAQMEAFSRPLWGLVPLLAGHGQSELLEKVLLGLRNGTDPKHSEYWGTIGNIDQRMVEMPPLALSLILRPDIFWHPLNETEKANLVQWLDQINQREICPNNWLFFAVLVNLAFLKIGVPYHSDKLYGLIRQIDDFYIADGWYSDGKNREQRDYYIPFAIYYYGLIYAALMQKEDAMICDRFKQRARMFASEFLHWFAADGSALPFGRSLTYRFAQAAFWGALAFADVEALPWAVIKGLYMRNLRWWLVQPVFTAEGLLTIGYCYPNLNMSEEYNAPGSPYWALKAFLPLALEDNHPFWLADEAPLPLPPDAKSVQPHSRMIVLHSKSRNHVFALHSGQWPKTQFVHNTAKYGKFAYSNVFGFSVPRESFGLSQGAFDSVLALSENDGLYRTRRDCTQCRIDNNMVFSIWHPWRDVEVQTWLIPANPWHVRIHRIESARELTAVEGGFSVSLLKTNHNNLAENSASVISMQTFSGIMNLAGERKPNIIEAKPNTNLIHSRTVIPMLEGSVKKGVNILACAVLGELKQDFCDHTWQKHPKITINADDVVVEYAAENICTLKFTSVRTGHPCHFDR